MIFGCVLLPYDYYGPDVGRAGTVAAYLSPA